MTEATRILLIDHYTQTPAEIAKNLEGLIELIGEREEEIYRCTCEDGDTPRGSWEWDTNAYNHHRDCPSGSAYHYEVLLRGLVRHFREEGGL